MQRPPGLLSGRQLLRCLGRLDGCHRRRHDGSRGRYGGGRGRLGGLRNRFGARYGGRGHVRGGGRHRGGHRRCGLDGDDGRSERRPGGLDRDAGRLLPEGPQRDGVDGGQTLGAGHQVGCAEDDGLAPRALRARHQQQVVLVVELVLLVRLVEEGEARTLEAGLGAQREHAVRGYARRRDGCRRRRLGVPLGRDAVHRAALHRYSLSRGDGYRDALRPACRVGPGELVLRQSLAGDVAAIGHVKAPSRPLPRPWRRDHRPQRPSAHERALFRPAPQPHTAAAPKRCGRRSSGALRHPGLRATRQGWCAI